jgi:hypothetical protein
MAENWKCVHCGSINPASKTKCLLCDKPRQTPEEAARAKVERIEQEKEAQIALEKMIVGNEYIGPKWDHCAISFSTVITGQRGLLPFSYKTSEKEEAYLIVYGKEGVDCKPEQIPEIIGMLGDNGWELAEVTQSTSISQLEGVSGTILTQAWYFKRQKSS